jgi:hypothetical protein
MKAYWLFLCTLVLVCSCSKEDDFPVSESIVPSFVGQKQDSGNPDTRAKDATWTLNDPVGIYMLKTADGYDLSKALHKNRKHTVTNVSTRALTPASGQTMSFPINGENVRFAAYYPHNTSADNNANTLTFNFTDQDSSDGKDKEAKDFVFHKGTTDYSKSSSNVALSFKHKFSKIKITLVQGDGGPDLSTLTAVTLTKMPASANVNLASLALDETSIPALGISTSTTDINPYIYDKTTTGAIVEAIVAPHNATGVFADPKFEFTVDGIEYSHPLNTNFEAGKGYNFVLTLMPQEIHTNTPDGLTNCYMIAPGRQVEIPITRAITYGGMSSSAAATVHVLWDDNSVVSIPTNGQLAGSGANRTFTVKAIDLDKQGNAVVALQVGTEIYWSWHIWVTKYNPNTGAKWTNNGYTLMDRNLGATDAALTPAGHGLLFQWGRKDPFPGIETNAAGNASLNKFFGINQTGSASSTTITLTSGTEANKITTTIRKPTTFYSGSGTNNHWLLTGDTELWGTAQGTKTIYDPCPMGWRVPDFSINNAGQGANPYTDLGDWTNEGVLINNIPNTGYRSYNRGAKEVTEASLWTSNIRPPTGAWCVYWDPWFRGQLKTSARGYARSIRCAKE